MVWIDKIVFNLLWFYVLLIPCSGLRLSLPYSLDRYWRWGEVVILVAFILSLILKRKKAEKERIKLPFTFLAFYVLFIAWLFLSYFWSIDQEVTFFMVTYFLRFNILIVFLLIGIIKTDSQVVTIMKAYVLGCLISSLDTVHLFYQGVGFGGIYTNRYAGSGFDPNDLGLTLSLGIPMTWYVITNQKKYISKLFYFVCVTFSIYAIFLTGSRGAFIASLAAILVIPLTYLKQAMRLKILLLFIIAMSAFLIANFVPVTTFERFSRIPAELRGGHLSQRIYLWEAGFQVYQNNPILGVGAGAFPYAMSKFYGGMTVAHNTFLSILAEEGLIGLTFFILIILALLNKIRFFPSLKRNIWFILMFTWVIGASSLTWDYFIQTWFLLGLAAAQISVQIKTNES